ncbi:programmed cell death protein 2-like [Trichosurus vulpecula]|uniref:programmed cell death protein 2-like n=1 Tax=Trichosurus vulpecula TaxID=9337 RepID=UPI00186B52EB|nr:programmed cell death protein 2-like [Trichosurus vulpecula]
MAASATPVLLGLRDAEMRDNFEEPQDGTWAINKMGGIPDSLPAVPAPRPGCGRCGAAMAHVVQVYCPLEGSPYHRLLHVFACVHLDCVGQPYSWKVFRSQFLQMQEEYTQDSKLKQKEENNFAVKDWCEGAEDWGDNSESDLAPSITNDLLDSNVGDNFNVDEDIECMSQLQELTLDKALSDSRSCGHTIPAGEGHVLPSSSVPVFQPYYISVVDEEDYTNFVDTNHAQKLLQEYRQREGVELEFLIAQSIIFDNSEKYEKAVSKSNDKIFYKFMKRISACREQILRYSWNGQPLFITCPSSDATEIPSCSNCGSCRIFEFQLMPALVSMLKNTLLDISVEFGTILIYTCQKSCWPSNHQNPMEEFCVIQEDPDQMLFK